MGRGRDLTTTERAMVHSKIKIFWDYENKKIKHGKVFEIRKLCAQSGVPCSGITVKRIAGEMKLQEQKNDEVFAENGQVSGLDFTPNRKGNCGRISKLTEEVKEAYRNIIQRYAHSWTRLSEGKLTDELSKIGYKFSTRTVHEHLQELKKRYKTIKLKPILTNDNKKKRVRYVLNRIDKSSQHRARYKFEDSMDTIMVDESWFYLTKDSIRIMLIEDMDVLINPKVHHKDHIEKIMFLSIVARPRKVMWEGREIDFDGKIGIIPCTEDYVTKKVSKHGPRGTTIEINKNVDSEFYHNMFCRDGGVFDMIEAKMP